MYCKDLLIRHKQSKIVFYCRYDKRYIISLLACENCLNKNFKKNKPIKKVSNKRITVTEETYNKVIQRDNYRCRLCGSRENLQLHHIDGRGKNLTNNIDNCIMLCMNCHLYVVHKNLKKYRPILRKMLKM